MGDFTSTYGDELLILTNDADIVLGTAQLGDQFGTIKRAVIRRTGDRELIQHLKTRKLLAVLIHNPGFEMVLECAFSKHVIPPGMGESLSLPLVGVTGFVMEGVTVQWESGSERGLSIPVNSWDVMQNATAYRMTLGGEKILLGEAGLTAPTAAPVLTGSATITTISVSWNTVARAARYELQVSADGGSTWTLFTETTGHATAHTDLEPETLRQYRVRAKNSAGEGPWSDVLELETGGVAPSSAPTLSGSGSTTAYTTFVYWNANIPYAEDYELQSSSDGGSSWGALIILNGGEYLHEVNAASAVRKYRVRARNSIGTGPWSNIVTLTTLTVSVPALTASVLTDGVYLQWSFRSVATHYELQGSDDGEDWATLTDTTENSHTDNFESGTRYYRVRALSALETGDWSEVRSGTVGIIAPVVSLAAITRMGQIMASFAPVPGAVSYTIQFSKFDDFSGVAFTAGTISPTLVSGTTADQTLGSPAGHRTVYVRARVATPVVGPWSDVVTILSPPGRPGTLSMTDYILTWSAGTGADRYIIEVGGAPLTSVTGTEADLTAFTAELASGQPLIVYSRRDSDSMESIGRAYG